MLLLQPMSWSAIYACGLFLLPGFALLASASFTAKAEPAANPQSGTVDLGRADAPALRCELTGVGETKALAIVAYRESIGLFVSDELFEVKGIDKALPDKNREKSRLN
ncbi:ComEA family DNA-binding protein [Pseudomonas sp. GV085]|jgi:competence protein ComEA|uniref:ComEA family DNA-binding protein n=1 Tax=Pseudomonas sp. GV085 TaxID=2135756 RepID=UPI000D4979A9|nr:competence protein ComEA [Pseudomonas sp. GV085]